MNNLFEQKTLVHKHDPPTSRDAAERVIKHQVRETWRDRILNFLRTHDRPTGWTCEEMAKEMAVIAGAWQGFYYIIEKRMGELHPSNEHPFREELVQYVPGVERGGKRAWRAKCKTSV